MAKYKVLSTKKLDTLHIENAKQLGIEIIEQEFIAIKPVKDKETFEKIINLAGSGKSFIALTSSTAVDVWNSYRHAGDAHHAMNWNIFCLSGKTKEVLLTAGLPEKTIVGEAANAAALANEIISKEVKEIVFFCGNKRRDELPDILKKAGIKVHEIVLYATIETPAIAADDWDAVLFFSPTGVQSFFSINQLKKTVVCFAIGPTTASSLAGFIDNTIIVSEFPSQEMMLASVYFYFQNMNCYE